MKTPLLLLCLVTALLSGCASAPYNLSTAPGERRIAPTDRVAVALAAESADRTDRNPVLGEIQTGAIWKSVFAGEASAPWSFTVTKVSMRDKTNWAALGYAGYSICEVEGILSDGARRFPIKAEAKRGRAIALLSATRQAAELAIVDAAKQCAQIIANTNPAPAPLLGAAVPSGAIPARGN